MHKPATLLPLLCRLIAAGVTPSILAAAALAQARPLAELQSQIPADVFENTTDGMEPDELKTLLDKGASANWTLTRPDARRLLASARKGRSEVRLTRKTLGSTDLLEALTLNEKAVSYGYWVANPAGGTLARHDLPPRLRVFNETEDGSEGVTPEAAPPPLQRYVEKLETCQHWLGEAGDDAAPARREIAAKLREAGCDTRSRDRAALEKQFKGQPRWLVVIHRASSLLGD